MSVRICSSFLFQRLNLQMSVRNLTLSMAKLPQMEVGARNFNIHLEPLTVNDWKCELYKHRINHRLYIDFATVRASPSH